MPAATVNFQFNGIKKIVLDFPGKCWHENTSKAYAPGESFDDKTKCERLVCEEDLNFIVAT